MNADMNGLLIILHFLYFMSQFQELPVYKTSYDLLLEIFKFTKEFGKDYKCTVGESLKIILEPKDSIPAEVLYYLQHAKKIIYNQK